MKTDSVAVPPVHRRTFLQMSAAAGAALISGGLPSLSSAASQLMPGLHNPAPVEASIIELQAMMSSGALTSRELTRGYLERIKMLNPLLNAVIEINHQAMSIAAQLDVERRSGRVRGPLHGIPILLKDNISTGDKMETTAGSFALLNSQVPGDAALVSQLRKAGAVILGKANLSEWANFRGAVPVTFNGWSARGGFTRNPYLLEFDTSGSSSGPAVAAAAGLCAAAVGTETDGSIVTPAGNSLIVGLKPTVGLVPQQGIIPIGHSQDTAGPMGRSVTDVAILLGALQSPSGPITGRSVPDDYTKFLRRGALRGSRIGLDQRYFSPDLFLDPTLADAITGLINSIVVPALEDLGAIVVPTDTGDPFQYFGPEFTVLLFEFKVQIAQYLATLTHTNMKTLADLIAFNADDCPKEMKFFEIFEAAEETSGDLTDPTYRAARELCLQLTTRDQGIDGAIRRDNLDAIIAPSYTFASSPAAVPGYPSISVPVGQLPDAKPVGIWMYSTLLQEPRLLAFAYDLEQALQARRAPQFLGSVPPPTPDAGICATITSAGEHRKKDAAGKRHRPTM